MKTKTQKFHFKLMMSGAKAGTSASPYVIDDDDVDEACPGDKRTRQSQNDANEPPTKALAGASAASTAVSRLGSRAPATPPKDELFLVCISDTHGSHDEVDIPEPPSPESVLIHCGDFDSGPKLEEWLNGPPMSAYKYKLVVCGNHDDTHKKLDEKVMPIVWDPNESKYESCLEASVQMQEAAGIRKTSVIRSAVLLHNSGVTIGGHVFWGSPYHTADPGNTSSRNRNFERDEPTLKDEIFSLISNDTAVLITHCGPKGILDRSTYGSAKNLGSSELLTRVSDSGCMHALRLHVFGHVHAAFTSGDLTEHAPDVVSGARAAQTTLKKCGSNGVTPVAGDVRVVRNRSRVLFANAAGLRIAAGQMHFQKGKDLEPLGQGTLRAPLVFRLPAGDVEDAELVR